MKSLRFFGIVIFVATLLFGTISCTASASAHVHTFETKWTTNDTHHWHNATCGHKNEVSKKAAHKWKESEIIKSATCTESGSKKTTCEVCGYEKIETITATEHDLKTEAKDPTCTEPGTETITCTKCDYTETKTIPAKGHTPDEPTIVDATCTESGTKTIICAVCNEKISEEIIDPKGHTAGTPETEPATCTTAGSEVITCTVCNKEISNKTLPAKGHTFATGDNWTKNDTHHWHAATCCDTIEVKDKAEHTLQTVTTPATCTSNKIERTYCTKCDWEKIEETSNTKLTHSWDAGTETTSATCTEPGVKTLTCSNCGETKTEQITALGHDWGDWEEEEAAQNGKDGVQKRECKRCDATERGKIPALDHSHNIDKSKWESDETNHWHQADCNDPEHNEDIAPHRTNTRVTKLATCTETGTKETYCEDCDYVTKTEAIPMSAHTKAAAPRVTKAATCTETGLKEDYCSACSIAIGDPITIPAKGHSWNDGEVTTAPTCSAKGVKTYTCTECGATRPEDVAMTDHTLATRENPAATCTTVGTKETYCTVCEAVTGTEEIPATGHSYEDKWTTNDTHHWHAANCGHDSEKNAYGAHNWGSGEVTITATCTTAGERKYTCSVCDAIKTEPIAAKGHSFKTTWESDDTNHWHECENCDAKKDEATHTWDAGTTSGGVKIYTCTGCGKTKTENVATPGFTLTLVSGEITVTPDSNGTTYTASLNEETSFTWYFNNEQVATGKTCNLSTKLANVPSGYYELLVTTTVDGITYLARYVVEKK